MKNDILNIIAIAIMVTLFFAACIIAITLITQGVLHLDDSIPIAFIQILGGVFIVSSIIATIIVILAEEEE